MNGLETGIIHIGTFSSVAINWLPNIFSRLQRDYPGIEYEMLLGDYREVEQWIKEGRVDCGFLRLPTPKKFDIIPLKQDEYKVILPVGHPLAGKKTIPLADLDGQPFLLLEHGGKTEVSDLLESRRVHPDIRFTTWEDFAIMAMVERGMGVSILPDLILKRSALPDRDTPLGGTLLPLHRACHEKPSASDPGGSEVYGIPALPGDGGVRGA